jgi:CheY-like chemotaxis protein/anti-sigma regulatory factor (Ser/Thr protein kinase)
MPGAGVRNRIEERMSTTVLLAEDDASSREIYHAILDAEGYRVIDTADGNAALDVLNSEPVDLLLTDIMMPGMTGIELLERARKIHPDLRAIVMTGHKTSEAVIGALRNRACEFLSKPFGTNELVEAVRSVMSREVGCQIEVISDRPDWIELRVPCDLNAVEPIQKFLGHLHEHIPIETRESVGAVFRELLNNAIEHGGKCDPTKRVEIKFIHLKRAILYSIKDPGEGFNIEEIEHAAFANPPDQPTKHMEKRQELGLRPGGFGIMLASQVIDELVYNEKRNELIFVKYIDKEPQS